MADALRHVGRKTAYWLLATAAMMGLMVSVFALAGLVHERWFSVHLLLAPIFALIGLALIVVGRRARGATGIVSPVPAVGVGLLVGGVLYGLTANVDAVIYSFAGGVMAMLLLSAVLGHRR